MKMSRFSLLLAIALFVAPVTVFGENVPTGTGSGQETSLTPDQQKEADEKAKADKIAADAEELAKKEAAKLKAAKEAEEARLQKEKDDAVNKAKGMFAAVTTLALAGKNKVFYGLDTVAEYSFKLISDRLLNYFTSLKGGKIEANIPTINRLLVSATFATALYAAYKLYKSQQQNDEADDIDLDFDSEENDNKYNNRYNN